MSACKAPSSGRFRALRARRVGLHAGTRRVARRRGQHERSRHERFLPRPRRIGLGRLPATPSDPHGEATDEGYANDIVSYEASRGVTLALTQLGCPGESTGTMISGDDSCYRGVGSQLSAAVTFLQSHQNEPGFVTIDLGFNDFHPCLIDAPLVQSCVGENIEDLNTQLTYIVGVLKAAAGPHVSFCRGWSRRPLRRRRHPRTRRRGLRQPKQGSRRSTDATLSTIYASVGIPTASVIATSTRRLVTAFAWRASVTCRATFFKSVISPGCAPESLDRTANLYPTCWVTPPDRRFYQGQLTAPLNPPISHCRFNGPASEIFWTLALLALEPCTLVS